MLGELAVLGLQAYSAYSASKGQEKSNQANTDFAREQMAWSAEEASKNRSWMEYMSNTSHQREVKDLREAGLNPILSASHGAPMGSSSMPSAPTVHQENTKKYNPELAIATAKLANESRLTSAMVSKTKEEQRLAKSHADTAEQESKFATSPYGKILMAIRNTLGSGIGSLIGAGGAAGTALKFASLLKGSKTSFRRG